MKADDAALMSKKKDSDLKKGLLTANLGSKYDIPDHHLQSEAETKAGTTVYSESTNKFA